ncbi:MAG: hypothetical protein A2043_08900 [Candidatus Schekmanbacteria bacterium GWA2_38_9]|nr:MAG: hypothetical protein A2043_08900 [Candidatus Schekmanbacteria bacterium GWA2_38_9]
MAKANVVKIEHFEVKKKDIDFIKKAFNVKDNVEAIKAAIDSIAGNLEIKSFFEKNKGIKIKRVYD